VNLSEANHTAHAHLEGLLMKMLGAAVDGRISDARALHRTLRDAFEAHVSVEDARTLPLLRDMGGPLVKLAIIVDGDHRILDRSLNGVQDLLNELDDGPDGREAVLGRIEVFSKLKTVLEHHGAREQEDVYAPLDARFPEIQWAAELLPDRSQDTP